MTHRVTYRVTERRYCRALRRAWETRPEIAQSLTDYRHGLPVRARCYLSPDGQSGFAIVDGEIVGVFSTVRGRGDGLVTDAVASGGYRLDCFDGYLPSLYARHGFTETHREANWSPGGPDVVYMVNIDAERTAQ